VFRTDTGGRKRLSPLLLVALRESGIEADAPLLTVLRTAYLREELRARAYRQILGEVLAALRDRGLPFLLLKGAALAETVYPDPVLRHAHDVDLLVAPEDAVPAAEMMEGAGLAPARMLPGDQGREFSHESSLPFLLHRRLYRLSYYPSDFEALRARAAETRVAGVAVAVPSPADQLLHALGHASCCRSRSTLLWVTDAWMLASSGAVNWTAFLAGVEDSRLELPVFTMVSYLRRELGTAVPGPVVDEVGDLAARAGGARRDVALVGVRQKPREPPEFSGSPRGHWKDRLELLRWRLFPSGEYMRWAHGSARPALLPVLYVTRAIGALLRRLAGKLRRLHISFDDGPGSQRNRPALETRRSRHAEKL
jgi:hypothetical protein